MSRLSKTEQIACANDIFRQFNKNLSRLILTNGDFTGSILRDFPADMQPTIKAWRDRWAAEHMKNWGRDWKKAFIILDDDTQMKMPIAATKEYPYPLNKEDIEYVRGHWKLLVIICRQIEIVWAQLCNNFDTDFQKVPYELDSSRINFSPDFLRIIPKLNLRDGITAFRNVLNIISKESVEKLIDGLKKEKEQHFMMHYWMDGFSQRFQRDTYVRPEGGGWGAFSFNPSDKKMHDELYWSTLQNLFLERYSWNELYHPGGYSLFHFINTLPPLDLPWLTVYFDSRNFADIRERDENASKLPYAVWQFEHFYKKLKQYYFRMENLLLHNHLPSWVITVHSYRNEHTKKLTQKTILLQIEKILDYAVFQSHILLLAISFKSPYLSVLNDFFEQLENDKDKRIIASVLSAPSVALSKNQSLNVLPLWCILAKQLRDEYGIEIVEQILTLQTDLTDSIKISELFLDLVDYFNLQLLNRKHKSAAVQTDFRSPADVFLKHKTTAEVIACLKTLQIQYWEQRFPEKSVEQLRHDFLTVTDTVKSPLSIEEFEILLSQCQKIDAVGKEYFGVSSVSLGQRAKALGKNNPLLENDKIHLFAVIREMIRQEFEILPRKTQLLAVLGMMHYPDQMKGRIAQMKTGEGKSTVITLLATFLGCQGRFVDIITSNHSLAMRDKEKYAEFYALFGITCSHICNRNQTAEDFNGQIIYAINTDVEFSLLWNELRYYDIRYTVMDGKKLPRSFDAVVIDEVDVMFIENARNSAQIADHSTVDVSWVYQPFLVEKQSMGDERFLALNLKELRCILAVHQNGHYASQTPNFTEQQLKDWRNNAVEAQKKIEGEDYIVEIGSRRDPADTSQRHIVIMDRNTGHLSKGTQWPGGLHQFIEIKHAIPPSDECNTIAAISHPVFFNKYREIYGLTGTIGESIERREIEAIYHVDIFDVPTHSPVLREKKTGILTKMIEDQTQKIIASIQLYRAKDRPVLILFETINQTEKFSVALKGAQIPHLVLNEKQKEKEDFVIARAREAGAVTVATNMAGRGTDIVLSTRAKAAGGLHVIFAFYPQNLRIEEQGFGRAGRQGQPGSGEMILSLQDKLVQQLLQGRPPEEIALMLLSGNFISFLQELRTQSILEASRDREVASEKETALFFYLNRLFEALNVMEKQLTSIDANQLMQIANGTRALSDQNQFLILKDHPVFMAVLRKMQEHAVPISNATIDYLRTTYLTLLRNRWACWYTQVSNHEFRQYSIEKYKMNLQEKFDAFCAKGFALVCEKPLESFYGWVAALSHPAPTARASQNRSAFFVDPVASNDGDESIRTIISSGNRGM